MQLDDVYAFAAAQHLWANAYPGHPHKDGNWNGKRNVAKEHSINSVKLCTGIIAWKDYFDKYRPDYEQKQQKKEEKHRVGEDMSQWDQQQAKLVSRSIEVSKFPQ